MGAVSGERRSQGWKGLTLPLPRSSASANASSTTSALMPGQTSANTRFTPSSVR